MLSDLFNYSVFPIFLLVLAYSIVSAPKFSGKLWSKITKLALFILAIVYTFNIAEQMHSKSFYLKTIQHVTQVESVTKHLEQLLDEGKSEQVKLILKKFNEGYSNSYYNPTEFKIFINSLIEHSNGDIPMKLAALGEILEEIISAQKEMRPELMAEANKISKEILYETP